MRTLTLIQNTADHYNRGTRNIDAAWNTRCHLVWSTWEVLMSAFISLRHFLKSFPVVLSNLGRAIVTTRAHSHIAMETIRDRRLVTMVWYVKANLMAMKRSTLIKARWRMMTETRKNVKVPLTFWRTGIRKRYLALYLKVKLMMSRIRGIASKPSAVDKLTRMMLDAVRRFEICETLWASNSCRAKQRLW